MRPLARFIRQKSMQLNLRLYSASPHNKRIKRNAQGRAVQSLKAVVRIPLMRRTLALYQYRIIYEKIFINDLIFGGFK